MNKVTLDSATRQWVGEFNAISQSLIERAFRDNIDDLVELTTDDDNDEDFVGYDSFYPMWGTMWTFGSSLDEDWARDNIDTMSKCGFRIYEDQCTGDIYFGIDGAGYDFYSHHWIPLYKARGLQWHDCIA